MALPSLTELGQLEFMSPYTVQQAQAQMGLGMQQAQQNLDSGALDMAAKGLANMFAEKQNPQLLDQTRLMNEGRTLDNRMNTIKAADAEALAPENRAAKRAEMLKSINEDELKGLLAKGQALMLDPDPDKAERGKKMMEASWDEVQRRAKAADRLKETEMVVGGRKEVAATNAGGASARNILDNATKLAIQGMKSADNAAKLARVGSDPKTLEHELKNAYAEAARESDPEKRADLLEYANGVNTILIGVKQAAAGQQIDTAAVANLPKKGTPAMPTPPVLPTRGTGRGDPPAGSGMPMEPNPIPDQPGMAAYRQGQDMLALQRELANAKDPAVKAAIAEQMRLIQSKPAPAAKTGTVTVVSPDGRTGTIPAEKLEAALKAGYKQR